MKKISQQEFEAKIQDVIAGKISRVDLAKELQTDIRTLNNRIIQEIGVYNPDLYIEYIKRFPYKQKERDDIDYEALVIEMIKNRIYSIDAAIKYNVGVRTIQRKVEQLEKENPNLIRLYREVKKANKNNIPISMESKNKIDELVLRPVRISEVNTTRREQLEEIERIFNNRCQFVSKQEAANSMGISMNRIYKSLNELYRMRIEENYTQMEDSFRESLRVQQAPTTQQEPTGKVNIETQTTTKKGEER